MYTRNYKGVPIKKVLFFSLILSGLVVLAADMTIPAKAKDLRITIYNNNLAFVSESREATVEAGEGKLIYEGVASHIITESVIPTFSGVDVHLFSQNYIYNLITLHALLEKSIGQKVHYYSNAKTPTLKEGVLLAAKPSVIVRDSKDGMLHTLQKPSQVLFADIPKGMITRPSLVWHVDIAKAGKVAIELKYLTTGISWQSAYVMDLKERVLDLAGWITVKNDSGVTYRDARIACVAGELHRAPVPVRQERYLKTMAMPVAADVAQESFAGYHLYTIPFRETIEDKSQKQIRFIDQKGIGYHSYGLAQNSYFENYGSQKLRFTRIVTFVNSQQNHAGMPLPAGIVRIYSRDSRGRRHFIGEDRLKNLPVDENVTLRVGTLFDVVGEKRITRFESNKYHRAVETTYEVRNRGESEQTLHIQEHIPRYGTKITLQSSCKAPACKIVKKNAFVREFIIRLEPKSRYEFTSSFEVLY